MCAVTMLSKQFGEPAEVLEPIFDAFEDDFPAKIKKLRAHYNLTSSTSGSGDSDGPTNFNN